MPRYFFDVYDGVAVEDRTGRDLGDLRAAQKAAAQIASEMLDTASSRLWRDGDWTIWVRDASGLQLFSVMVLGMLAPALRGRNQENLVKPND